MSSPTARRYVIDRLGPGGAEAGPLVALLTTDGDVSVRRAALLALADFDENRLPLPDRERLTRQLVELYRDDPDPGIHGVAGWLLRQWGQQDRLEETRRALPKREPDGSRRWYETAQGQTMVLIAPGQIQRGAGEGQIQMRIDYGFAIAAREVTISEFQRFRKVRTFNTHDFARADDCPVHLVCVVLTWRRLLQPGSRGRTEFRERIMVLPAQRVRQICGRHEGGSRFLDPGRDTGCLRRSNGNMHAAPAA